MRKPATTSVVVVMVRLTDKSTIMKNLASV
jgi:hypothetical protein